MSTKSAIRTLAVRPAMTREPVQQQELESGKHLLAQRRELAKVNSGMDARNEQE